MNETRDPFEEADKKEKAKKEREKQGNRLTKANNDYIVALLTIILVATSK